MADLRHGKNTLDLDSLDSHWVKFELVQGTPFKKI